MVRLHDLVLINPWWKYGDEYSIHDADLKRLGEIVISRRIIIPAPGRIYVYRGVRRSGKTVYIKLVIGKLLELGVEPQRILYLSCDRLASRRELLNIIRNFYVENLGAESLYLFLDEVTYLEDWNIVLKNLAETAWAERIAIVATGSNPVTIRAREERLPGRRVEGNEYYFKPLTFREFIANVAERIIPDIGGKIAVKVGDGVSPENTLLRRKILELKPYIEELTHLLNIYLLVGGFPEAITSYLREGTVPDKVYEEIIRLILGDISKLRRSEEVALAILRYILENPGRTDYKTIAAWADIHHETARDYMEALQDAFIIHVLKCWDLNRKIHHPRKQKKIAFTDPLLYHAVQKYVYGLTWEEMLNRASKDRDRLVEMAVISHLAQLEEAPHLKEWWSYLGYYYDRQREIDAVLKMGDRMLGFEIKYREQIKRKKQPIRTITISKNHLDLEAEVYPAQLFLASLKKSQKII